MIEEITPSKFPTDFARWIRMRQELWEQIHEGMFFRGFQEMEARPRMTATEFNLKYGVRT